MSASWFLVSMYLDFGIQIDSIEQPVKGNSVGPGNVSHCGTPSFDDHLDHCFVVLKHMQQSFLMRKMNVLGRHLARDSYHGKQRVTSFCHGSESCFQELQRSDPISQEREHRLTSILHPKK